MDKMKQALAFSMILFGAVAALGQSAPSGRFSNPLLEDVVQMTRAGLSDATIVAYLKARQARLDGDVSADDLIRLQRAGVDEALVRYIAGATGIDSIPMSRGQEVTYDSSYPTAYPVEPSGEEDYAYPYPYGYGYGYPYWYAYSPYFSGAFFISGGPFFHGGGFTHHGHGHFSRHGGGHHGHGHR